MESCYKSVEGICKALRWGAGRSVTPSAAKGPMPEMVPYTSFRVTPGV